MNARHVVFLVIGLLLGGSVLVNQLSLPPYPPKSDIVIVSPHPDDAVLCCSGVIQKAVRQKQSILVVTMTNGDDFTYAASLLFHKEVAGLTARDMIRFAGWRQREDTFALRLLGVPSNRIIYLAYPDSMVTDLYAALSPITLKATEKYATYIALKKDYHDALYGKPGMYTKAYALGDLTEIFRHANPREVYVTGPLDSAGDHEATYSFVRDALESIRFSGTLFTSVIHASPDTPLPKPDVTVRLTPKEVSIKRAAIMTYYTQYTLLQPHSPDFDMMGFAKPAEAFWMTIP